MTQDQLKTSKPDLPKRPTASRIGVLKRNKKPSSLKPLKSLTKTPSLRPIKRQSVVK